MMKHSKTIIVHSPSDLHPLREKLAAASEQTRNTLRSIASAPDPIASLSKLKFEESGFDPLDPKRPLNIIEQVNQTFTYWATFDAVKYLFRKHQITSLTLNLGTQGGSDISSDDDDGITAEVFAATTPKSNNKLRKDAKKVSISTAKHKYVFFSCPGYEYGVHNWHDLHPKLPKPDVIVVSLGMYPGGTHSGSLS